MRWKSERAYHRGDDYFDALKREISRARESVVMEMYIFENRGIGREIADLLVRKAQAGVSVRLLVDGVGSSGATGMTPAFLQQLLWGGVSVRIYHPVRFGDLLGGLSRFVGRLNRRTHRKLCVVDGEVAFVGGINVMNAAIERATGARAWRDSAVRIEGPGIKELERAFETTWRRAFRPKGSLEVRGRRLRRPGLLAFRKRRKRRSFSDTLVRLNDRRRLRRENYRALIRAILTSKKRLWISTAYFVPSAGLVYALRFAAWSGVDVRILVPRNSDVFFIPWVSAAFYQSLLHAGIRIFEYLPTVLHAKILIVDDRVSVGTSNLNTRSLFHDLEVDVILRERQSIESFANQFEADLKQSEEVLLGFTQRSIWARLAGRIALLIRYFL